MGNKLTSKKIESIERDNRIRLSYDNCIKEGYMRVPAAEEIARREGISVPSVYLSLKKTKK